MKKTLKPILSYLLAFAMLLPLLGGAAKATDATVVTVTPPTGNVYYLPYTTNQPAVEFTAAVTPNGYDGDISWSFSAEAPATITQNLVAHNTKATVVARPDATENPTIATVVAQASKPADGSVKGTANIVITRDSVKVVTGKLSSSTVSLGAGAPVSVSVGSLTYKLSGQTDPAPSAGLLVNHVSYTSVNRDIAEANSETGVITPHKAGTASFIVTVDGIQSQPVSLTVTPSATSANVSAVATAGAQTALKDLKDASGNSLYAQILAGYQAAYGVGSTPAVGATIVFTPSTNPSTGSITSVGGAALFSDLLPGGVGTIAFTPGTVSPYAATYQLFDPTGVVKLTGTLTISVSTPTSDVNISLPASQTPYVFSSRDAGGVTTGAAQLQAAVGNPAYTVRFALYPTTNLSSATAGQSVGTLFMSSTGSTTQQAIGAGAVTLVPYAAIPNLCFVPLGYVGAYSIGYDVLDAAAQVVKTGTLTIRVTNSSLQINLLLSRGGAYSFSENSDTATGTGTASSAANMITTALYNYGLTAANYSFTFTTPSTAVGSLKFGAMTRDIAAADMIAYTQLSLLYFVPAQAGTFQTGFSVYSADGSTFLASGTLNISVNNVLGEANFTYSTVYGKQITLGETEFANFVRSKLGSTFTFTHVIFNDYSPATGGGTFYYGATNFTPRSSVAYYSRSYPNISSITDPTMRFLDGVSFAAPNAAGSTTVSFTVYGVNATGVMDSVSGVFRISYTAAAVPVVEFNAYNTVGVSSVTLTESAFLAAYRTAMGSTSSTGSGVQFYIRLKGLPNFGILYQNYVSPANSGTQLTTSTYAASSFYIGGGTGSRSVGTLTYVPLGNLASILTNGTVDKVEYEAYSSSGTLLYTGVIQFRLVANKTATVTSDGLDFALSDFYSQADSDPVLYVVFNTPELGKLYIASGNRLIPVASNTRLYTVNPADGAQPISMLHYVPQYGQTTPVTLTYTAYAKSGMSYTVSIVVTPTAKTASQRFNDIPAATASWAAGSIDFASKFGLVQGTGNGKFEPNANMHRCDLVLILYRLAGSPATSAASPYSDVTADKYYYASAVWAAANHIMDGIVTGNKYQPMNNITRQEYIRILYNYAKATGLSTAVSNPNVLSGYTDASGVAAYASDAMKWAVEHKYILSTTSGTLTLSPGREATRAEIVTLLHRFLTC